MLALFVIMNILCIAIVMKKMNVISLPLLISVVLAAIVLQKVNALSILLSLSIILIAYFLEKSINQYYCSVVNIDDKNRLDVLNILRKYESSEGSVNVRNLNFGLHLYGNKKELKDYNSMKKEVQDYILINGKVTQREIILATVITLITVSLLAIEYVI